MSLNTPTAPEKDQAVSFDPLAQVHEFHQAFNVRGYSDQPDAYGRRDTANMRLKLIAEETKEVADELLDFVNGHGDRVKLAKELADLQYVVNAAADLFDIPLNEVFTEVHRSNMSKLGADGKPVLRQDGKILKGPNYKEPDIETIVLQGVSE